MLNAHPVVYTVLHGDKDTYKLAFDFAHAKLKQRQAEADGGGVAAGGGPSPRGGGPARPGASGRAYRQVSSPPRAVGGLGPQAMVGGEAGLGDPALFGTFCGQALLQRAPALGGLDGRGGARGLGGGGPDPPGVFLHRVLAKYNTMNLLSDASWRWVRVGLGEGARRALGHLNLGSATPSACLPLASGSPPLQRQATFFPS